MPTIAPDQRRLTPWQPLCAARADCTMQTHMRSAAQRPVLRAAVIGADNESAFALANASAPTSAAPERLAYGSGFLAVAPRGFRTVAARQWPRTVAGGPTAAQRRPPAAPRRAA